jgi:hypothetical protein
MVSGSLQQRRVVSGAMPDLKALFRASELFC